MAAPAHQNLRVGAHADAPLAAEQQGAPPWLVGRQTIGPTNRRLYFKEHVTNTCCRKVRTHDLGIPAMTPDSSLMFLQASVLLITYAERLHVVQKLYRKVKSHYVLIWGTTQLQH